MKSAVSLPYPQNAIHAAMYNRSYLYNIPLSVCRDAIQRMNGQEKDVISKHYAEGISFRSIAKQRDITPSRVTQIHQRALMRIRRYVKRYSAMKPLSERQRLIDTINLSQHPVRISGDTGSFECEKCSKTVSRMNGYEAVFIVDESFEKLLQPDGAAFAYRTRRLCKECTYRIAPFVMEADGKKYKGIGRKHAPPD